MTSELLSVGIDLGTSTTQLVLSKLRLENSAGAFAVPKVDITQREVIYRSAVHFTPLLSETRLDAAGIRAIVEEEYAKAGVTPDQFQTGAVIITGETARKENAREVLEALAGLAGDFVVATAGPDLESLLAARGAGVDKLSKARRAAALHYDIGGGTSNLALFDGGKLVDTGCLDVGGRLIKVDPQTGRITYVFHKIREKFPDIQAGKVADETLLRPAMEAMTEALLEAGGLKPSGEWLDHFVTHKTVALAPKPTLFSFSGGVADCIWSGKENAANHWDTRDELFHYGDVGVLLGRTIRRRFSEVGGQLVRGEETIRATVVGAGSYATEVSGSTIFYKNVNFPLKNLPVLRLEEPISPQELSKRIGWYETDEIVAISLQGVKNPNYSQVNRMANGIREGVGEKKKGPLVVVVEADMAKALGQTLAGQGFEEVLCLDSVAAPEGSYLDILAPAYGGTVLPVVVKTLAFEEKQEKYAQKS